MVNPYAQEKLEYPFELLLTKTIHSLRPDDAQLNSQKSLEQIGAGESFRIDLPFQTSAGQIIDTEGKIGVTYWGDQKIFFGLFRDVTEKRKAERVAQHVAKRDRLLAQISTHLINLDDPDAVRSEIHNSLSLIGRFYEAQQAFLCLFKDGTKVEFCCEWSRVNSEKNGDGFEFLPVPEAKECLRIIGENEFSEYGQQSDCVMEKQSLLMPVLYESKKRGLVGLKGVLSIDRITSYDLDFIRTIGEIIINTVISQRRRQRLKDSEKRLSYSMKAAKHAVWDMDLSTGKLVLSPLHLSILGGNTEDWYPEVAFEKWVAKVHPEDKQNIKDVLKDFSKGNSNELVKEYRVKNKDGGWTWLSSTAVILEKDDSGAAVRIVGTHTDITEQKNSRLKLQSRNVHLQKTIMESGSFHGIIGQSPVMQEVFERILQAAASDTNVIVYGESGTGKELVANAIQKLSDRSSSPFLPVNCGAIPDNLIESEFFGHIKGAFTGADTNKDGYLDQVNNGTILLDELGELPLVLQVKLLRALDGHGYTPVGGTKVKNSDFRIIAATNRNLKEMIQKGSMREDFYYRLHVVPINLPPLRDRKEDIPLLIYHFLNQYNQKKAKFQSIPGEVIDQMLEYQWPGNVRELQNVIFRFLTLNTLDIDGLDLDVHRSTPFTRINTGITNIKFADAIAEVERELIVDALRKCNGNKSKAASLLSLPRRTLHRKLNALGIDNQSDDNQSFAG